MNAPASDSAIRVILALKGSPGRGPARLVTNHPLQEGEYYLVFGGYENGIYDAFEDYRVVPIGADFSTNSIAGKPLDEQLQILFKQRIANLDQEIQKDQQEKQRLEEGLTPILKGVGPGR